MNDKVLAIRETEEFRIVIREESAQVYHRLNIYAGAIALAYVDLSNDVRIISNIGYFGTAIVQRAMEALKAVA